MSQKQSSRIAFVGSGVMAEVMINGLLSRQVREPDEIWASGPREERTAALRETYGIHASTDNLEAVSHGDIVVLAVKPQTLAKVLQQIQTGIRQKHLVMSIIAGARG
ncbi:MAG TPA: NAD(P)-binding domain-containing protein [Thermoanaerobaculia bacterium]